MLIVIIISVSVRCLFAEKLKKREEELEVLLMERSKREEEGDMEEGTSLVEHELMEDGKEEGVGGEREGKGSCESGEASE